MVRLRDHLKHLWDWDWGLPRDWLVFGHIPPVFVVIAVALAVEFFLRLVWR